MSDRIKGFTVVLSVSIRDDDFESIKNAVLMIKGVTKVIPSKETFEDSILRAQIKNEIMNDLLGVLE